MGTPLSTEGETRITHGKSPVYCYLVTVAILICFIALAISQGDFPISGKGDDGYFWKSVIDIGSTDLNRFYPNIAFLRLLNSVGLELDYLYVINLTVQTLFLLLIVKLLYKTNPSRTMQMCLILWIATSMDILFVTAFLMRDLYILLFIIIFANHDTRKFIRGISVVALAVLRPFSLGVIAIFTRINQWFIALALVAVIVFYFSGPDNLIKAILMPNAVFTGQEFSIEDVLESRTLRTTEGQNQLKGDVLSMQLFSPMLMMVRPIVPNQLSDHYVANNGLTGRQEQRSTTDPYILWQNSIVPLNCIYVSMLFVSLAKAILQNKGNERKNALYYLIGTTLISVISGQGRHHLMISWLEPIIIAGVIRSKDIPIIIVVSGIAGVFWAYLSFKLLA